jgi:hypothetical protein
MFQITDATYYPTTSEVLGKLYSNTMMMNLNSRMPVMYNNITNDIVSNEIPTDRRRPVFSTAHGGISVTREEWTDEESSSRGQPEGDKGVHPPESGERCQCIENKK